MSTYHLKRLSRPEILHAICPRLLGCFLAQFRDYFQEFDLEDPVADLRRLAWVLGHAQERTPPALIDALHRIDEMATPSGMDALLDMAERAGIELDHVSLLTPADVALRIWLEHPGLLEACHHEMRLLRLRAFHSFQSICGATPGFRSPSARTLEQLALELDEVFADRRRGRGTTVEVVTTREGLRFDIRHGEPFRREGCMDRQDSVAYRPERFDRVVYLPLTGELQIHARSEWERQLYRTQFGRHLFGNPDYFPDTHRFSLLPLRTDQEASLSCIDVPGIEAVALREIQTFDESLPEVVVRRSPNLFAVARTQGTGSWLCHGRLLSAAFHVKYADSRKPRSIVIRPPNVALYTRDEDSSLALTWLERRGFILTESKHAVVESA